MAQDPEGMDVVTPLQALARRVADGGALADQDAPVILGSHDLITIGTMSDDMRRRMHGTRTTFVRVFEMHVDAVPAVLPPAVEAGEFRLVGRPADADAAVEAVRAARALARELPLFGFSSSDLEALLPSAPGLFGRLRDAGLDGIAETAVDTLGDVATVQLARAAGLLVLRLTVHAAPRDPLVLLQHVRGIGGVGGFHAFAPLPRTLSVSAPTTGYDDVKLVALARLMLPDIPSIQVDWPLYGPKLAQVGLTVGADDVDGVAATDAALLGARRSALEEIRKNITAAGLQPVERNGRFQPLEQASPRGEGRAE